MGFSVWQEYVHRPFRPVSIQTNSATLTSNQDLHRVLLFLQDPHTPTTPSNTMVRKQRLLAFPALYTLRIHGVSS